MNKLHDTDAHFEARLLAQLRAVVAERGIADDARSEDRAAVISTPAWRRRAPRLALSAAAVLAAVVAGLIGSGGGDNTSKAFAVEPQAGGGVAIKIYSLSEPENLEKALDEAGIPSSVTYLPAGMTCREPRFRPSKEGGQAPRGFEAMGPGGPTIIGIGNEAQRREFNNEMQKRESEWQRGESTQPTVAQFFNPDRFGPDQTLVLTGSPLPYEGDPTGGHWTQVQIADGPVGPCEPVKGTTPIQAEGAKALREDERENEINRRGG
ncbi:MAG TPA: hypothetical protein VFP23_07030 [Solirubrobacterales bacterium]|nr:hypothetical protein [Solirubrobacterales bacterium]